MSKLLQSDLTAANPVSDRDDVIRRELVRRMSREAQQASASMFLGRVPWWKRPRTIVPVGIAGALALTGAAVLIPLDLAIDGTRVDLDAEIPITYTTDTGVHVSCRYGIYFGDLHRTAADEQLAEFVKSHDWSGIGQRIYDEAISNPFVPGPDDEWEVDTQELRDGVSFFNATDLIWKEIPDELQDVLSAASTSDCTGVLR